jgi:hypothetical protein
MGSVRAARSVLTENVDWLRQDWYLTGAEYHLAKQCMKSHGFDYVTPDMGPEPGPDTITTFSLGTGHQATYGITLGTFANPPYQPDWHRPGFSAALDGRSTRLASVTIPGGGRVTYETDGCTAAARTKLYGSVRAYVVSFYLPQIESNLFHKFTGTDQPYLSAQHRWQTCMKAHQLAFTDPQDAAGSIQQLAANSAGAAELSLRQTAVAEADTACDARSQLRQQTNKALQKFVDMLPTEALAQLGVVAHDRARAYQVARQVVSR